MQTDRDVPFKLEAIGIEKAFQISSGFMKPKKILHAVNGASFHLNAGETIGVVGESGCGKSTLADILLGLEQASAGEVKLNGRSLLAIPRREIASLIQPVFQDPFSSLNPRKTIHSIIALPLKVSTDLSRQEQNKRVEEMLLLVGLPLHFLQRLPHQLSGGQRQRVAIARALVLMPEIVVLDEPTSALDVSAQAQILNLLKDLQEKLNLSYIFISHDLSVIEYMVDRIIVFYLGKIVEITDCQELFSNPGHPYTRMLLSAVLIPEPGKGIPKSRMEFQLPDPTNLPKGCGFHPRCPLMQSKCQSEAPSLRNLGPGMVSCHFSGESIQAGTQSKGGDY